jgi:hypothetical protein
MSSSSRRSVIAALMLGLGGAGVSACTTVERDVVTVPPPAMRAEIVPVLPPERVAVEHWQPGHWRWNGREYVWVEGRYAARPRPQAVWMAPRWDRRGSGWVYVEGRWT